MATSEYEDDQHHLTQYSRHLEDDEHECGWDASGIPKRYRTSRSFWL
jgi:hypothetical protein